jgi:hypothetical protein
MENPKSKIKKIKLTLNAKSDMKVSDMKVPGFLTIQDLKSANVGHAWVTVEFPESLEIPNDLSDPTLYLWKTHSKANIGFYPQKTDLRLPLRTEAQNNHNLSDPGGSVRQTIPALTGMPAKDINIGDFVPGIVVEPDDKYEKKEHTREIFHISIDQFMKMMNYVNSKRRESYSILYYNCTDFAVECCHEAGQSTSLSCKYVCLPDEMIRKQIADATDGGMCRFSSNVEFSPEIDIYGTSVKSESECCDMEKNQQAPCSVNLEDAGFFEKILLDKEDANRNKEEIKYPQKSAAWDFLSGTGDPYVNY